LVVHVTVALVPDPFPTTELMTGATVSAETKLRGALELTGSVVELPDGSAEVTR
jgi:hypothetical protein